MSKFDMVICRTCKFWDLFVEGMGFCRRNAPELAIMDPEQMAKKCRMRIVSPIQGLWPITQGDDFCGEHQPVLVEKKEKQHEPTNS
jgi:hypothetical protein